MGLTQILTTKVSELVEEEVVVVEEEEVLQLEEVGEEVGLVVSLVVEEPVEDKWFEMDQEHFEEWKVALPECGFVLLKRRSVLLEFCAVSCQEDSGMCP